MDCNGKTLQPCQITLFVFLQSFIEALIKDATEASQTTMLDRRERLLAASGAGI